METGQILNDHFVQNIQRVNLQRHNGLNGGEIREHESQIYLTLDVPEAQPS